MFVVLYLMLVRYVPAKILTDLTASLSGHVSSLNIVQYHQTLFISLIYPEQEQHNNVLSNESECKYWLVGEQPPAAAASTPR